MLHVHIVLYMYVECCHNRQINMMAVTRVNRIMSAELELYVPHC